MGLGHSRFRPHVIRGQDMLMRDKIYERQACFQMLLSHWEVVSWRTSHKIPRMLLLLGFAQNSTYVITTRMTINQPAYLWLTRASSWYSAHAGALPVALFCKRWVSKSTHVHAVFALSDRLERKKHSDCDKRFLQYFLPPYTPTSGFSRANLEKHPWLLPKISVFERRWAPAFQDSTNIPSLTSSALARALVLIWHGRGAAKCACVSFHRLHLYLWFQSSCRTSRVEKENEC